MNSGVGYNITRTGTGVTLDASDPFPVSENESRRRFGSHPFLVYQTGKDESDFIISVVPGSVNNLDPQMFETTNLMTSEPRPTSPLNFGGNGESYVYLRCGPTPDIEGEGNYYPDPDKIGDGYPMVIVSNSTLQDTDTYGYILLAKAKLTSPGGGKDDFITLTQYVRNSLWTERFKCGDEQAIYWFTAV